MAAVYFVEPDPACFLQICKDLSKPKYEEAYILVMGETPQTITDSIKEYWPREARKRIKGLTDYTADYSMFSELRKTASVYIPRIEIATMALDRRFGAIYWVEYDKEVMDHLLKDLSSPIHDEAQIFVVGKDTSNEFDKVRALLLIRIRFPNVQLELFEELIDRDLIETIVRGQDIHTLLYFPAIDKKSKMDIFDRNLLMDNTNCPWLVKLFQPENRKQSTIGASRGVGQIRPLGSICQPTWGRLRPQSLVDSDRDYLERGPPVIVFMVGGLSFAELSSVYEVSEKFGREVMIGSTNLVSPRDYVDELYLLGDASLQKQQVQIELPSIHEYVQQELQRDSMRLELKSRVAEKIRLEQVNRRRQNIIERVDASQAGFRPAAAATTTSVASASASASQSATAPSDVAASSIVTSEPSSRKSILAEFSTPVLPAGNNSAAHDSQPYLKLKASSESLHIDPSAFSKPLPHPPHTAEPVHALRKSVELAAAAPAAETGSSSAVSSQETVRPSRASVELSISAPKRRFFHIANTSTVIDSDEEDEQDQNVTDVESRQSVDTTKSVLKRSSRLSARPISLKVINPDGIEGEDQGVPPTPSPGSKSISLPSTESHERRQSRHDIAAPSIPRAEPAKTDDTSQSKSEKQSSPLAQYEVTADHSRHEQAFSNAQMGYTKSLYDISVAVICQ
eukprot:jgi/Hompol1/6349/HPOL_002029-RA